MQTVLLSRSSHISLLVILQFPQDKVRLQILSSGLGSVTEREVELAKTSGASLFGFNVDVPRKTAALAKSVGINIASHRLIYRIMDEILVSHSFLIVSATVSHGFHFTS